MCASFSPVTFSDHMYREMYPTHGHMMAVWLNCYHYSVNCRHTRRWVLHTQTQRDIRERWVCDGGACVYTRSLFKLKTMRNQFYIQFSVPCRRRVAANTHNTQRLLWCRRLFAVFTPRSRPAISLTHSAMLRLRFTFSFFHSTRHFVSWKCNRVDNTTMTTTTTTTAAGWKWEANVSHR